MGQINAYNWAQFLNLPGGPTMHTYWEDFDNDKPIDRITFVVSGHSAPTVMADEDFGVITFNSGANATDNAYTQMQQSDANVLLRANKEYWFITRLLPSDATDMDVYAGLAVIDAAGGPTAGYASGVFLRKDDGDTAWDLVIARGASTFPDDYTQLNGIAVATANYTILTLRIKYGATDGYGQVSVAFDGSWVIEDLQFSGTLPALATALAPTIAAQNGSAAARTLKVDYYGYASQR